MSFLASRRPAIPVAERMKMALESSADAVALTDRDGCILWCNAIMTAVLRWPGFKMIGRRLSTLLPLALPNGRQPLEHPMTAILNGRPLPESCFRDARKAPVRFWDLAGSWVGPRSDPMAVFWLHDVTSERLERREANRVAAIHAVTGEAVACLDPDGLITHWNSAAERMYGYAASEIVGRSARILSSDRGRRRIAAALDRFRAGRGGREPISFEDSHAAKNGSIVRGLFTVLGWPDENGEFGGLALVATDVTEQRRMEALIGSQLEQLKRSNRELERFAVAASRDLLEPLRKVNCFSELLRQQARASLDERSRMMLDHIVDAGGRMAKMVEGLLDQSRPAVRTSN